jgi:hypothetical protein
MDTNMTINEVMKQAKKKKVKHSGMDWNNGQVVNSQRFLDGVSLSEEKKNKKKKKNTSTGIELNSREWYDMDRTHWD